MTCSAHQYLVLLHFTTAGKQGEDLGTDETGLVLITLAVFDSSKSKSILFEQHTVMIDRTVPNCTGTDCGLTEECCAETGLDENSVFEGAQSLSVVLKSIDRSLQGISQSPTSVSSATSAASSYSMVVVTDGQAPLRLVLHPQLAREDMDTTMATNYDHFFRFIDIRKAFRDFYKADKLQNLDEMIQESNIFINDNGGNYGRIKCHKMLELARKMTDEGYTWDNVETISRHYNSAIVRKTDYVGDDTVVRARGLPWQATDSDICRFFRGLNIERGGIALVLSKVGRRNGEALIRLQSREHRDLALRKHKHHMGQRYIEVYMATGRDFIQVAGGETEEAEIFLQKLQKPGQTLIRMRGLPYTATANQILDFFAASDCHVDCGEEGILFVNHSDGRATGDAFVIFGSEPEAEEALKSHRGNMGSRYIELFKSTPAEVNQVMNGVLHPVEPPSPVMHPSVLAGLHPATLLDEAALLAQFQLTGGLMPLPPPHGTTLVPTSSAEMGRVFVRITGMPLEANVADIIGFIDQWSSHIAFQGVHVVYNSLSQPAGEAIIQMTSEQAAIATVEMKNHQLFSVASGKKSLVDMCALSSWELTHFTGFIQSPLTSAIPSSTAAAFMHPHAGTNGPMQHSPMHSALYQLQLLQKQMIATPTGIAFNQLAYPQCWPCLPPAAGINSGAPQFGGMVTPVINGTGSSNGVNGHPQHQQQHQAAAAAQLISTNLVNNFFYNGTNTNTNNNTNTTFLPAYTSTPYQAPSISHPTVIASCQNSGTTSGFVGGGTTSNSNKTSPQTTTGGGGGVLLATSSTGPPTFYVPGFNFIQTLPHHPHPQQHHPHPHHQQQQPSVTLYNNAGDCHIVIIKNLPKDVLSEEIINIFEPLLQQGVIISDIKVGISQDGNATGEAFVAFINKPDADRAVLECSNRFVRSHLIEVSLY